MEIIVFDKYTWNEIPQDERPKVGQKCLVICKQEHIEPPYRNTGEWEVLMCCEDLLNDGNWDVQFVAMFWELSDAKLFATALLTELEK